MPPSKDDALSKDILERDNYEPINFLLVRAASQPQSNTTVHVADALGRFFLSGVTVVWRPPALNPKRRESIAARWDPKTYETRSLDRDEIQARLDKAAYQLVDGRPHSERGRSPLWSYYSKIANQEWVLVFSTLRRDELPRGPHQAAELWILLDEIPESDGEENPEMSTKRVIEVFQSHLTALTILYRTFNALARAEEAAKGGLRLFRHYRQRPGVCVCVKTCGFHLFAKLLVCLAR